MGLTHEDVERILRLIDESGYDEVRIEYGDLKLHVRRKGGFTQVAGVPGGSTPAPAPRVSLSADDTGSVSRHAGPAPASPAPAEIPAGSVVVRAPMLGTFYRASSPGAAPFVEIGSEVRADSTVCLIEVMKLFNTLKAGVGGRVTQILVENAAMVEYDQALIVIEPKSE